VHDNSDPSRSSDSRQKVSAAVSWLKLKVLLLDELFIDNARISHLIWHPAVPSAALRVEGQRMSRKLIDSCEGRVHSHREYTYVGGLVVRT
jgi:hypothetical protein